METPSRGVRCGQQNERRAQELSVLHQAKPEQNLFRIPRARILGTPTPDRLLQGPSDLGFIQVGNGPACGRLILPAMLAVQTLQEHAVVFVPRQHRAGVADPAIRLSSIAVWAVLPGGYTDDQHLAPVAEVHPVDGWKRGRIDGAQLFRHLLDRMVADLLAKNPATRLDTEEHPAAPMVEHRAQRARSVTALSGRALELERLGFSGGCPGSDLLRGHSSALLQEPPCILTDRAHLKPAKSAPSAAQD